MNPSAAGDWSIPAGKAGKLLAIVSIWLGCSCAAAVPPFYHKTSDVLDFFRNLATTLPGTVRYQDIPDPGVTQLALPFVTVTDFSSGEAGKEVILIVAGEHARELITSEVVFWLGLVLTGQDGEMADWPAAADMASQRKAIGLGRPSLGAWVQQLLRKVVFKIIPVENIEGRKAVEAGDLCLRKTVSGVDLNRNWPVAWQKQEPSNIEYGGPEPFSEPESRIVHLAAQDSPLRSYVNLHSGEFALYVPWDSQPSMAPGLPADIQGVLDQLNMWCKCMRGAAGSVAGYLAMGTSMDYLWKELHVPYPLTWELYGPNQLGKLAAGGQPRRHLVQEALLDGEPAAAGDAAQTAGQTGAEGSNASADGSAGAQQQQKQQDCFSMFNPGTLEEYQETIVTWVAAFLTLADHLTSHPVASSASHTAEQEQQPPSKEGQHKMDLAAQLGTDEEERLLDTAQASLKIAGASLERQASHASIKDAQNSFDAGLQQQAVSDPALAGQAAALAAAVGHGWSWQTKLLLPFSLILALLLGLWRKAGSPMPVTLRRRKRSRSGRLSSV